MNECKIFIEKCIKLVTLIICSSSWEWFEFIGLNSEKIPCSVDEQKKVIIIYVTWSHNNDCKSFSGK